VVPNLVGVCHIYIAFDWWFLPGISLAKEKIRTPAAAVRRKTEAPSAFTSIRHRKK
jgi:hypothetical protein